LVGDDWLRFQGGSSQQSGKQAQPNKQFFHWLSHRVCRPQERQGGRILEGRTLRYILWFHILFGPSSRPSVAGKMPMVGLSRTEQAVSERVLFFGLVVANQFIT
jgi:hypothetical protein